MRWSFGSEQIEKHRGSDNARGLSPVSVLECFSTTGLGDGRKHRAKEPSVRKANLAP